MRRGIGIALPCPDADMIHVIDRLSPERSRLLEILAFLQEHIRETSMDYWNREEFPSDISGKLGA